MRPRRRVLVTLTAVAGALALTAPVALRCSVPWIAGGRGDRAGVCFPYDYVRGQEYLLVMQRHPHRRLTPYWASMALVAEQVRGDDDPWRAYVRGYLAGRRTSRRGD